MLSVYLTTSQHLKILKHYQNMDKDILRKIGLTDSEIEIYLDLIKHEESLASETALRVKLSRTYVYDAIQNLIEKGLISYVIKNGRKYFKALDVGKLLEYLDDKTKEIENQRKEIFSIIKELKNMKKSTKEKPIVDVLEGAEGLKTMLNDIVKQKKDVYGWGASNRVRDYVPDWYVDRYIKEKDKLGIKTKQLYSEGTLPLEGPGYINKKISKDFSSPVTFGTYGDRIMILFWSQIPIQVRIINKDIAKSFRDYFEFLWKKFN